MYETAIKARREIMHKIRVNFRRLPLENVHNLRDLGGYAAGDRGITQWHVFLRSDNIYNLSEKDKQFLLDYGLTTVIDLRSADEVRDKPNPLCGDKKIKYYNIPLLKSNMSDLIKETTSSGNMDKFRLSDLYIGILEQSKSLVREVFEILAAPEAACTLFHCTAGKDRTGVVAALLLDLAAVSHEDIMSNYEITNTHLRKVYGELGAIAPGVPMTLIESSPVNIEVFLKYLYKNYSNAEKYLLSIGLSPRQIAAIKDKFVYFYRD